MTRGGKVLLLSGCLAGTGCGTDHGVQVRAIGDLNSKTHYSGGLLGEARAQLAMGAVGLAIESFRTLQRQQPDNVDAYAGLAASYAAMGRYDLTRTNYEIALAYAPDDSSLLQALATTLDRLGETEQAAQVRTEIRIAAAKSLQAIPPQSSITPFGVPRRASMTLKVPEASPAPVLARKAEIQIAGPRLGTAKVELAQLALPMMNNRVPTVQVDFAVQPEVQIAAPTLGAANVQLPHPAVSMMRQRALAVNADFAIPPDKLPRNAGNSAQAPATSAEKPVQLPPLAIDLRVARASEVAERPLRANAAMLLPEFTERPAAVEIQAKTERLVAAAPIRATEVTRDNIASPSGPYLERTSLREVALITVVRPTQQAKLQPRAPQLPQMALIAPPTGDRPPSLPRPRQLLTAAALRWMPLRYASRPQNIALLNAARADGLAARTRVALVDRGWRKIAIGNAHAVRQHSLVLYAPGHMRVAARLAAQFRCRAVRVGSMKSVVVLLGRDAVLGRRITSRA